MADNNDDQEEELVPENIRKVGFWVSLTFSVSFIIYYVAFIFQCVTPTPNDLGLSSLLLFSAAWFLFFSIPWHKFSLSLKKFGPLEFERKLEGQNEERIKDFSELEDKIARLEAFIEAQMGKIQTEEIESPFEENKMRKLIIEFLTQFEQGSFSPFRIEKWLAKQEGYSSLKADSSLLRRLLRSLVSEGILETRVSKKGNTLYRIK